MIVWSEDDKISITSDVEPCVAVRIILKSDSDSEIKSKKKYPFICKREVKWTIDYEKTEYNITIPKGYCYDGASIPRLFWRVIGSKESNEFLVAALVHDYMCEHHDIVGKDRKRSSEIFRRLLLACGVSKMKADIMYLAVDNFQKCFGKWGKDEPKL